MSKVFVTYNSIISPLGFDSEMVARNIKNKVSGISLVEDKNRFHKPFYGSVINQDLLNSHFRKLNNSEDYTTLEKMMLLCLNDVITNSGIKIDESVGLIISTTKGNIDALDDENPFPKSHAYLSRLGQVLKDYFSFQSQPTILSNACVSGLLAVATAKKFIEEGLYKSVLIVSGDLVSKFVLSGFNAFQAMSNAPCKPYSKDRNGINLGEAIASVLVTSNEKFLNETTVEILGEATCNDANHISGPSRTGEGLYRSVKTAIQEAEIEANNINYISAHGTATIFNDEMEAIAFHRLGLTHTPLNSLKGYFGHTLGSSALVETIVGMHSLNQNILFTSKGFTTLGVSKPLQIIEQIEKKDLNIFLKTASGFGGCNTAMLFKKVAN
ncbi:beta-ketoacyl synthase N-terminal-like domain-containing protein [Winogradskyella ursingii]|uniref:beta-ketoacyl synthase N-terminal-like domain-containing protein n=1 Tax=Winogradskyella ursingii TaxID=2686079 RepID=UPI0015CC78BC|nr:beta-ketoacyl synthase N-terminal-like domain-containing protein [Winogradskyella ursingii]